MGKPRCVAFAVVAAAVISVPASAQQLSVADRALVHAWLTSDCGLGDNNRLENRLRERAPAIEPALIAAATQGPDTQSVAEVERAAGMRYEQIRKMLDDRSNPMRLSDENRNAMRAVSRDEFVNREKNNFILRYKAQAIAGMGIAGKNESAKALESLARDRSSPLQSNAQRALAKLRGPSGPPPR